MNLLMNNTNGLHRIDYNPWWICNLKVGPLNDISVEIAISLVFLVFFGALSGFGLTYVVQATVPIAIRRELLKGSHFFVGFIWTMATSTCSLWSYPLLVFSTYLWGTEPYDNAFSVSMWKVTNKLWRQGEKIHAYWAVSSLIIHVWFLLGAASLQMGIKRPSWIQVAICGFTCSHMARVFAYDYADTVASVLEVLGVTCLVGCVVMEAMDYSWFSLIWLVVSTVERMTHLPAAFRRDANWMRSYDLWEAATQKAQGVQEEKGYVMLESD
eukprot:TRINITY_DN3392_c0_g1_i2.p1 TRINITY_DN3392_c0_g1~~TRINITY_DN3392_c0_g1_i2.p1  ORF type:complete len:269 (-),score=45.63 TRINITY_DN3392_c0_g1_i2:41-847(-)